MSHLQRVVVLVDMDCFYCQVEELLNPQLAGKPMAVVQYNQWQGGGIIAVNYAARDRGVSRHMRGKEAREKCPELVLVSVPTVRAKADLTKYRDAGKRVADVLLSFTPVLERASVDEAYLDITALVEARISERFDPSSFSNTHVVGFETDEFLNSLDCNLNEHDFKLAHGAVIAEEIRAAVYEKTGYRCSAGIAHNKILAKLAAGFHKPNQQTILPQSGVFDLFQTLPVHKIRSLGGKFGSCLSDDFGIKTMGDLLKFGEKELQDKFDAKTGSWLYNIARGISHEPVTIRLKSKSIGCCKKFAGPTALVNLEDLQQWVGDLSLELSERLAKDFDEYNRKAKNLVVSFANEVNRKEMSSSRTHALNSYEASKIADCVLDVLNKHCLKGPSSKFKIKYLGLSATKFEDCVGIGADLKSYFQNCATKPSIAEETHADNDDIDESCLSANEVVMNSLLESKLQLPFQRADSSLSVYSKSTLSPTSTTTHSLYVDEAYECKDPSCLNQSDSDSISNEIQETETETNSADLNESSFFNKYFEENRKSSVPSRDFDTSRLLLQEDVDMDEESASTSSSSNAQIISKHQTHDGNLEICSECNKKVSKAEMLTHMDHHYALRLSREQRKATPRATPTAIKSDKKSSASKGKHTGKKKQARPENCLKLTSFLQRKTAAVEAESGEPYEECPECKKRVPLKELSSHSDYHAAKKLHLELNPALRVTSVNKQTQSNDGKTVASYFKRL